MESSISKTMPTFCKPQLTEFKFRYIVNNFSKLWDQCVTSEKLSAPNSEVEWNLNIYPHGSKSNSNDYVSIFLHRQKHVTKQRVAYNLGILNAKNELTHVKCSTFSGTNTGWPKYVLRETLLDSNKTPLCGDQLTLQCTVYYCEEEINNQHLDALIELSTYKHKPIRVYYREIITDIVLEVSGEKIYVHKSVLSSASCVFDAMFRADMKESNNQVVIINDITAKTMEFVVSFIYDNEIILPSESICSLLEAADKYQIDSLKLACERELSNWINGEMLIEILTLADFYNAKELKNYALHCVVNNFSLLTANNEKWYEPLQKTLLFDIAKLMNEYSTQADS